MQFLCSTADMCIYGGQAGGAKTYSLLLHGLSIANIGSSMSIFRKTHPEIIQEGGLWDTALDLYLPQKFKPYQSEERTFNAPSGGSVTFSHMQHEKDKLKFQGSQLPVIGIDEATHFSETQVWYLISRNRDPKGLVVPHSRLTCNPDPNSWLAPFLMNGGWVSSEDGYPIKKMAGVTRYLLRIHDELIWGDDPLKLRKQFNTKKKPRSVQFIPSSVYDNKILLQNNPEYIDTLESLPDVEREQLLHGNWKIKRQGKLFKNPQFAWDSRYDTTAWVDTAFEGTHNTALVIGFTANGNYYLRGWSWRESITRLYTEIARLLKEHHCGTITFESNADKGASAQQFREYWESVAEHPERENKHNKIMINAVKPWEERRVFLHPEQTQSDAGKQFISNLQAYEEKIEPDDEADGMASWMRSVTTGGPPIYNLGNRS